MKEYNKCIPIGDKLYIERLNFDIQIVSDGIVLPCNYSSNNSLGIGKILKSTKIAEEKWGLYEGDYIMYDFHSIYDKSHIHTDKTAIIDSENVLLKLSEEEAQKYINKYIR